MEQSKAGIYSLHLWANRVNNYANVPSKFKKISMDVGWSPAVMVYYRK